MAMEVTVDRRKSEVQGAILQFAARREYRIFNAWWLDGQRLETQDAPESSASARRRMTSAINRVAAVFRRVFDVDQRPRLDIELKTRRGKTTVAMAVGSHRKSVQLAYELRSYLEDERAYSCECPPICHHCSAAVRNMTARFCGRCGASLLAAGAAPARLIDQPADRDDPLETARPEELEASRNSIPAVVVEREDAPDEAIDSAAETESASPDIEPELKADPPEVVDTRASSELDESAIRDEGAELSEDNVDDTPPAIDDDREHEVEEDLPREASPARRALAED